MTPRFLASRLSPLASAITIVTINFGVIYVGIPYLVLYSGVILTPDLEIQADISSCYLRHLPRQPKIQKNI